MNTVIIGVAARDEVGAALVRAWRTGKRARAAYITFETPELLWKVLTAKRWELIKALMGVGPLGVRELARRLGRDVRGVHADITALGKAGVIDCTDDGKVLFRTNGSKSGSPCAQRRDPYGHWFDGISAVPRALITGRGCGRGE